MKNFIISLRTSLSIYLAFILACLAVWSVSRFFFINVIYSDRTSAVDHNYFIFFQGIRFDIISLGLILSIPMLISVLISSQSHLFKLWQKITVIYLVCIFSVITFLELGTPSFIEQFDTRPNILFVEYLKYPKEVFNTLYKAYFFDIAMALLVIPSLAILFGTILWKKQSKSTTPFWHIIITIPAVALVCLLCTRSTLGHRPINPSNAAISNDLMVNSLALNSFYSLIYAMYSAKQDESGRFHYGDMTHEEIISEVRKGMYLPDGSFNHPSIPTLHQQTAINRHKKPKNLVIVLEESLGAEFVGSLGGLPLTPNIDSLASEGLWFTQMYATGTRSVRGIEAVITGFTPTPAMSVVKLQKSQSNFFTIAQLLKNQGYQTSFIYGGESHFDNMRSFFLGNGFTTIIEEKDYKDPKFVGSWGVSDEDLFSAVDKLFDNYILSPFFSLVFTSSNHTPFEYPDNTIEQYDTEKATVNNAVKYADYSVGEFIKKAKSSPYWDDTIFLIVADHNSRVYGDSLVPIERFHIPALIIGGGITPQEYTKVASQIDLIPTLLSLMGIDSTHPAIGHDLLRPDLADKPGRALMQYNATQAYLENDQVVVLQQNQEPAQFSYINKTLNPSDEASEALIKKALAHSLFGTTLYHNGSYRLPETTTEQKAIADDSNY